MVSVIDIKDRDGGLRRRVWSSFRRRRKATRWALERLEGALAAGVPVDRLVVAVLPERQAAKVRDEAGGPAFPKGW